MAAGFQLNTNSTADARAQSTNAFDASGFVVNFAGKGGQTVPTWALVALAVGAAWFLYKKRKG